MLSLFGFGSSHSSQPSLRSQELVSKLLGNTDNVSIIDTLKRLAAISPSEQLYILSLLADKTLGKNEPIDDRQVPFEKMMQVLATVPLDVSDKFVTPLVQQFWDDLERPPRNLVAFPFRSADGSNNSHLYPKLGASNSSYSRSVTSTIYRTSKDFPDARALFNEILRRPDNQRFEPHPTGVNSLLFDLAGVITHDLFRTDPDNPAINKTTHYVDLSPLYGVNQAEQDTVRTKKNGLLKPDTFADPRLMFQLPAIPALLIIFSRNHNYIAKKLLEEADAQENYRFTRTDGAGSDPLSPEKTDELLFQTARLVNGACYVNLVLHEYLRTILGQDPDSDFIFNPLIVPPKANPTSGNVVSVEFSYVYRWHSALSQADAKWLTETGIVQKYFEARKAGPGADHGQQMADLLKEFGYTLEELALGPLILGLHRNPETKAFNGADVIKVLQGAITNVASTLGARKVPKELEEVEVLGILHGRKVGVCTLNEFRRFFGLKEYHSYEELLSSPTKPANPDVVKSLERLYGIDGINKVELYPGVALEAAKTDGLSLPYTASRAILSDATNLLRNDRFYVDSLNPHDLTAWGYDYANRPGEPRVGSVFKKIVLSAFPEWYTVIGDPKVAEELLHSPFKVPKNHLIVPW